MDKSTTVNKLEKIRNLLAGLQATIGTPTIVSEIALSDELKKQINNDEISSKIEDDVNVHIGFLSDILYEVLSTLKIIASTCDFKCECDKCNNE